jgi:hypothetical protein
MRPPTTPTRRSLQSTRARLPAYHGCHASVTEEFDVDRDQYRQQPCGFCGATVLGPAPHRRLLVPGSRIRARASSLQAAVVLSLALPSKRIDEAVVRTRLVILIGFAAAVALTASAAASSDAAKQRVSSVPAAHTYAGSANEASLQGKIRIQVKGKRVGRSTSRGRFTISGVMSDRGRFLDRDGPRTLRTLVGAKGTIWIRVGFVEPVSCQCNWRIVKGWKAYAGLRGRGQETGRYTQSTVDVTMTGTVAR